MFLKQYVKSIRSFEEDGDVVIELTHPNNTSDNPIPNVCEKLSIHMCMCVCVCVCVCSCPLFFTIVLFVYF